MKKTAMLASMLLNAGLSTMGMVIPEGGAPAKPLSRQHNKNAKRRGKKAKPVRVYAKHTRGY